ncbi:protein FAM24A [Trichechus manatus latirostris]|uniref:Protein FAM24A n=1 Tax=Trichechus manatus latirostris TaxID=127582 RepID=A0A2Y9FWG4_TRIMA|nr:protein FAM24A [Trichechus manatus latirostris]
MYSKGSVLTPDSGSECASGGQGSWLCWEGSRIHCLPALLCLGVCEMFDHKTMIMIIVGSCLLLTALVLTGVVIGLYFKVTRARKAAKPCVAGPLKNNNSAVDTQAESVTPVSSATVQLCEECSLYAAYNPLPPCFCDTNEGL